MGSRKRTHSEATPEPEQQPPEKLGLLQRLRDFWVLASLMQYIAIFGKLMKIDEEFEIEVCAPEFIHLKFSFTAVHHIMLHL